MRDIRRLDSTLESGKADVAFSQVEPATQIGIGLPDNISLGYIAGPITEWVDRFRINAAAEQTLTLAGADEDMHVEYHELSTFGLMSTTNAVDRMAGFEGVPRAARGDAVPILLTCGLEPALHSGRQDE